MGVVSGPEKFSWEVGNYVFPNLQKPLVAVSGEQRVRGSMHM